MTQAGEFRHLRDGYGLTFPREGIEFHVKRLRWERGELFGLIVVRCDLAGAQTVDNTLSMGTWNLTSVSARTSRAKELEQAASAPDIPFRLMLEELAQRAIVAEQTGHPVVLLRNVEPQPSEHRIAPFHGLPVPVKHPTIVSAMGGTGKTTIAMGICGELERRSIPTLYLDYETNECDCRAVAERMFGAECAKLDLKYRRCERPLYLEAESIAEQVDECGIQFVIVDSAGYACDGRPGDAEVALRYFRALRQLRVGS